MYVEERENTKLLGLQRDKHLSWKNNNDKLIPKLPEACSVDMSQPVAYPGIFFGGWGVQQIQLRTEERENGDLGAVVL